MGVYVSYVKREIRYLTCPRCEAIISDDDLMGDGQVERLDDGDNIMCERCFFTFEVTVPS